MQKILFSLLVIAALGMCKPPGATPSFPRHPELSQATRHTEHTSKLSEVATEVSTASKLPTFGKFPELPVVTAKSQQKSSNVDKVSRTKSDQDKELEDMKIAEQQAKSARYHFATQVTDGINDGSISREETRDGLNVTGFYSYSDGNVKRTVYYAADGNGFRIVNTEVENLDGPHINPEGVVSVHTDYNGNELTYSVKGVPKNDEDEEEK